MRRAQTDAISHLVATFAQIREAALYNFVLLIEDYISLSHVAIHVNWIEVQIECGSSLTKPDTKQTTVWGFNNFVLEP